jgi:WD40 repeat protein
MRHSKPMLCFVIVFLLFSVPFVGIITSQGDNRIIPIAGLQLEGSNQLLWLPESTILVIANDSAIVFVDVAELESGDANADAIQRTDAVTTLAYDEIGERLIAGDDAGNVLFYDLADLENPASLEAGKFSIRAVAYDSENELLATANADEMTIWHGNLPEEMRTIELSPTSYITLLFDSEELIMGTSSSIQIIDPTGEKSTESIGEEDSGATSMLIYEDWLFEGKRSGVLRVSEKNEAVGLWRGHSSPIISLAIVPERDWIVSGDEDGLLMIRKIETRETVMEDSEHAGAILSLSVNEDSMLLASLDDTGRILIWKLD